ncbi:MAG: aminotransferase class V-fold PLP-dependent enzyme [Candidatus Levybacteria bacterium]|nr:aminotransferase class V-fold PLP-dependent enzyme [Candidatus Levybacteria bacterium]
MGKIFDDGRYAESLPILSAMNRQMYGVIRWCTPSIHPMVPKVNGMYDSDISISFHSLGNPSLNTGIFKKAHDLAAKVYKAEHTLFSVNGSTGSNFIVLKALSRQLGQVNILAQRNVHKSFCVAAEDYRVNVNYLQPHYDDELQVFIPNTIKEFEEGLKKFPETNVLFISNPTYEGLSIDLVRLVKRVRQINPKIIIFVDEAWGSLFSFSDEMPTSAMEAGVDVCVQSAHKEGSGLQQTSMIHWQGKRLLSKFVLDSYKSLITTSPSFHLLASMDAARYLMETQGKRIIDDLIKVSSLLRSEFSKIKGIKVIDSAYIMKKYPQVHSTDRTKVLVNVKNTGLAGYEIAHSLESEQMVVVEKYEADNILFLTALQNTEHEVFETAERLKVCLKNLNKKKNKNGVKFPKFPYVIDKAFPSYEALDKKKHYTLIDKSMGLICAEDIVPYPPGIPLIAKGEVIRKDHIEYLKALKKLKGLISLVMSEDSADKILVAE